MCACVEGTAGRFFDLLPSSSVAVVPLVGGMLVLVGAGDVEVVISRVASSSPWGASMVTVLTGMLFS